MLLDCVCIMYEQMYWVNSINTIRININNSVLQRIFPSISSIEFREMLFIMWFWNGGCLWVLFMVDTWCLFIMKTTSPLRPQLHQMCVCVCCLCVSAHFATVDSLLLIEQRRSCFRNHNYRHAVNLARSAVTSILHNGRIITEIVARRALNHWPTWDFK